VTDWPAHRPPGWPDRPRLPARETDGLTDW